MLRLLWRVPALLMWVAGGCFWAAVMMRILGRSGRRVSVRVFARGVLFLCGVRFDRQQAGELPSPCLVVSNHVSWLDIYVLHALEPMTFIAKSQIRSWPVIGWLVTAAGTLYIERGRRHAVHDVLHQAQRRCDLGERICFFPEGTTSEGHGLLKFHSNLFSLVERRPDLLVQPISIRYWQQGLASSVTAYVGEMTLVGSMLRIMRTPGLSVSPIFHSPIHFGELAQPNRRTLSDEAYARILAGLSIGQRA